MKLIGGCAYVHRTAVDTLTESAQKFIAEAEKHLPEEFADYQIIKYHPIGRYTSFIKSPDWDTANEPTVGDSCKVSMDLTLNVKIIKGSDKIYHHKWQFVKEDYKGFDVKKSKERSLLWESKLPRTREVKSRIQSRTYWNNILSQYGIEI